MVTTALQSCCDVSIKTLFHAIFSILTDRFSLFFPPIFYRFLFVLGMGLDRHTWSTQAEAGDNSSFWTS